MFFSSPSTLFIAILVVTAFYYAVLEFRWFRTRGTVRLEKLILEPLPSVSILITAHNEKDPIQKNISYLFQKDYQSPWNTQVADDRSTNKTPQLFAQYAAPYLNKFHMTTSKDLPEGPSGKKNAFSLMGATCESEIQLQCGVNTKMLLKTSRKETLKGLWEPRKRWVSKTIYNAPNIVFLLSMVFFLALCIVGTLSFLSDNILIAIFFVFSLKVIWDLFLTVRRFAFLISSNFSNGFFPSNFFMLRLWFSQSLLELRENSSGNRKVISEWQKNQSL